MEEQQFYSVYKYGDCLEPASKIKLEHSLGFNPATADLTPLVSKSADQLEAMIKKSQTAERDIFDKLSHSLSEWEAQGAQTLLLKKALEYVKTKQVDHTSNEWKKTAYSGYEISNMVYKMGYQIREDTAYNHKLKKSVPVKKHWLRVIVAAVCVAAACLIGAVVIDNVRYHTTPEPAICALCGEDMPYHAPVLLSLSTGNKCDLWVYQKDMGNPGELLDNQRDGYGQLVYLDGNSGYRNGGYTCSMTLRDQSNRMDYSLYCNECRELLSDVRHDSYVMLDMRDLEDIRVYPVKQDEQYTIRDYTVDMIKDDLGLAILVTGHIPFDFSNYSKEQPELLGEP